ncbi:extracellular solute-binding protein [Paenibacillus sinopodophylli]|uniref:extracellular solute-binding protein n=1 Tax=Paenibacillus sinopodophylli TaxID=1837342 RepID=UPI00110CC3E0|nr:extracellular solute-binding protein [Paenibacillus sinopodophylli]
MSKNWISIVAVLCVIVLLLTSCERGGTASEEDSSLPSPVEINVFAHQDTSIDLPTNDFTKLLERKFNAHFNWDSVSPDGAKEKRQISLAGGDYPDAYILTAYIDQFSQSDLLKYGKEGVILPLNELINEYAPHIKAAMEKDEGLRAFNTAPDGLIYGLAAYSECFHCSYPNKMWVNTKWLTNLGLTIPRTIEEFKAMLEAFKNRDPNGNGLSDEVPLSGSIEDFGVRVIPYLMNGFIYDDDHNYLAMSNGKVDTVANKTEWKAGIAYIKSLYDEGLIDPGAFIQNADALKRMGDQAGTSILGAAAAMHPAIFTSERLKDYTPIPPLVGPFASHATFDGGGIQPGAKFVITNKASKEAQIALIQMIDYIYTPEGQTNAQSGLEGIGWRKPEAGEAALGEGAQPQFVSLIPINETKSTNSGWSGMAHFYMPREYRDSWVASKDIYAIDGYERRLMEATQLYEGHEPAEMFPIWTIWLDPAEADEVGILQTNVSNYIEQSTLQFITGDLDLDKDWDSYIAGLESTQIGRYIEMMQNAYDQSATSK